MDFYFSDDFLVQLVFQCPGAMENHRSTVFREKVFGTTRPIILNQCLALYFRSTRSKFCPKLIILRSLRLVT